MHKKFDTIEILDAVKVLLSKKKDEIKKEVIKPNKFALPKETEQIISAAEKHLKKY